MKKYLSLYIASLGLAGALQAQTATATASIDIGNYVAPVRSDGQLFQNASYTLGGLEWPKVATNNRYLSYTGQLWMAGTDGNGALRVAANDYGQTGDCFRPGLSGTSSSTYNKVWKLTANEIAQFRSDFAAGTLNLANYPVIADWPAFVTLTAGGTKACAPFVDVDGNPATYNPAAGDYPDIPGEQAAFFAFTDEHDGSNNLFGTPLNFDIKGFLYGYSCSTLENVFFLKYDITNPTANQISNFYLGLWNDSDVGNYADDYFGCDTTSMHPMAYFYNGDANDETSAGYGLYPPAIGVTLLSEPAGSMMYYVNDFSGMGNPQDSSDFAGYISATWADGTPLSYSGTGYDTTGNASTTFAFTGDPGYCGTSSTGWYAAQAATPYDQRAILATDSTSFAPGETKTFEFSFLMARDTTNQNLGSVCALMDLQDSLSTWMLNGTMPCRDFATGISPVKPTVPAGVSPNPTAGVATLQFENPNGELAEVRLYDLQGKAIAGLHSSRGNAVELHLEGLAPGIYLARLNVGDRQATLRVVKQ